MIKKFVLGLLLFMSFATQAISQKLEFTLFHTSDEHSMLLPSPLLDYQPELNNPSLGGFARLASMVDSLRSQSNQTWLFSSGDILGGSPFAWLLLNKESAEIKLLHQLGYDAITIGNHEFDYGSEILARYYQRGGYPNKNKETTIIASNMEIPLGHELEQVCIVPYKLLHHKEGLTIGVFALMGKDAVSVAPHKGEISFVDQHHTAQEMVAQLKQEGAEVIIALTHSGVAEDIELANDVDGIDIILGGHDHFLSPEPIESNDTYIFHSGSYLKYLGQFVFEYEQISGELHLINNQKNIPYYHEINSNVKEDEQTQELVAHYLERLNQFLAEITDSTYWDMQAAILTSEESIERKSMQEHALGNLITDAMRMQVEKISGNKVDLALQANGIIRADLVPAQMKWNEKKISLMDLATTSGLGMGPDSMPGYPLVSIYLSAQEILNILELAALLPQLFDDKYFLQLSGVQMKYKPNWAYWFKIPFSGLPIPAYRSLQEAYFYTGAGFQQDSLYEKIDPNSEQLYHVVTDYYLGAYLPMIAEKLPRLGITLKNKAGEPISMKDAIVYTNGKEYKVWQALVDYSSHLMDKNKGTMPNYYFSSANRIIPIESYPLWVMPLSLLVVIALFAFALIRFASQQRKKALDKK